VLISILSLVFFLSLSIWLVHSDRLMLAHQASRTHCIASCLLTLKCHFSQLGESCIHKAQLTTHRLKSIYLHTAFGAQSGGAPILLVGTRKDKVFHVFCLKSSNLCSLKQSIIPSSH
jgi:hypothetical protein